MSKIQPLGRRALDHLPPRGTIFRVNPSAHYEFHGRRGRPVELKDPEGFDNVSAIWSAAFLLMNAPCVALSVRVSISAGG
jgi:hypothetical protein